MKYLILVMMSLLLVLAERGNSQIITDVDSAYVIKPLHSISNQTNVTFFAISRERMEEEVVNREMKPVLLQTIEDLEKSRDFYKDLFYYTAGATLAIIVWEQVR